MGETMTELAARQFEESADRLRRCTAERDKVLELIDADYSKALAAGAPHDLYTPYLTKRQSAINMFQLEAIAIAKDYTQRTPASSPPLLEPPASSPACPPPPKGIAPTAAGSHPEQQSKRRGNGASWNTRLPGMIIVACVMALGAVITISSIASTNNATLTSSSSDASTSSDYVSAIRTVLYEVEGTAEAVNITYQKSTGIAQQTDLSVPLTSKGTSQRGVTFSMNRGDFVYISAQNQGSSGTVTCRISVDGVVISTVTSRGGYTIATCDGKVP